MRHLLRLCAPLLMICACSSSENRVPEGPDGGVPPSVRAGLRDQGVDITALFAQPTAAEITAMRASWDGRVSKAASPKIVTQFALSGEQVMLIISQESPVGIQYGAVLAPQGALKEGSSFPILLNLHGLGRELALHLPDPDQNGAPPTQIITVWPAFQGHKLWFRDNSWDSLGNPWDFCEGGTDDALQMLDAALQVIPGADKNRIVAFGGSRGGNVALLAALRDPQIRAAISMAGPTDYFDEDLIDHPNSGARPSR